MGMTLGSISSSDSVWAMHEVVVVASHGVVPFDLSTPSEIFRGTRLADGSAPYRLTVCGVTRSVETADFTVRLRAGLEALARADTVIVPGVGDLDRPVPRELVQALRAAAATSGSWAWRSCRARAVCWRWSGRSGSASCPGRGRCA